MLAKLRMAMRIPTGVFDDELQDLIMAAKNDLRVAGVMCNDILDESVEVEDPLVRQAVITYCKLHWPGFSSQHDALKKIYDEQKAQLGMDTGHTVWEVSP